ncbi:MAG: threonine--tRNA ligase, partial [Synergistaceae bacterium]|nr:threonine--tRNA ligase [Synergistaceae bacterium]
MLQFTHDDKTATIASDKTTLHDALKSLSLDKKAIAANFNGHPCDLSLTVTEGGEISPIAPDTPEGLEILRHSTAHLMAQAVLRLYPGSHFGVGPAIKDGF